MYQLYDKWIDYKTITFYNDEIRGPLPKTNNFITFIGPAHTYGRYVENPYPKIVAESLGCEVLNLGKGGAGPEDPLFNNPDVLKLINSGKLCIIQHMSGRSVSNTYFNISNAQVGYINHPQVGSKIPINAELAWKTFFELLDYVELAKLTTETRNNYTAKFNELRNKITVPNFSFYYSICPKDKLRNGIDLTNFKKYLGIFPHLLNAKNLESDIECITSKGFPQTLPMENKDGYQESLGEKPLGYINTYYPTQEMHNDAAQAILEFIKCNQLISLPIKEAEVPL